jgi:hypothetical protein
MSICLASSSDGYTWRKHGRILDGMPGSNFMAQGVGEAGGFFKHIDGFYYLIFTGFIGNLFTSCAEGIGIARALSPLGPWDINPTPLLRAGIAVVSPIPDPLPPPPWDFSCVISPSNPAWYAQGIITPTARLEGDTLRIWFNGMARDYVGNTIGHMSGTMALP